MGETKNVLNPQDSAIHRDGKEVVSPIPAFDLDPMLDKRGDTELERIRSMIRTEVSSQAMEKGYESFEEANDFECEEDDEFYDAPETKYMKEEYLSIPPDRKHSQADPGTSPLPKEGGAGVGGSTDTQNNNSVLEPEPKE